jgi:hypothetical protein
MVMDVAAGVFKHAMPGTPRPSSSQTNWEGFIVEEHSGKEVATRDIYAVSQRQLIDDYQIRHYQVETGPEPVPQQNYAARNHPRDFLRVVTNSMPPEVVEARAAQVFQEVPLPGFRAAILEGAGQDPAHGYAPPSSADHPDHHKISLWLRDHLTELGLLPSLAHVLEMLDPAPFLRQGAAGLDQLAALAHMETARVRQRQLLKAQGWKVVAVPSMMDLYRSIHYLNGIHDQQAYLMPVFRGFYAPLDKAAADAFTIALDGEVIIRRILTAQSQRKHGAVHCAVSAFPRQP